MEQLPHGRHAVGFRRRVDRAKLRKRSGATRFAWVIVAIISLALAGIALRFGVSQRQASSLSAASNPAAPILGATIQGNAELAQDTTEFGRLGIVRVYYPGLPSANAWTTGLAAANHSAVIVSFKALPSDILSGADDAVLSHFFDTAPTGHPIYYSYFHEPEDNIRDGQFTFSDYKAAWAHVVALAAAAHNPNLHSTLILMEYDLQSASGRNWKDYLPGGGIISTLGWDAYPVGSATNTNPQLTPPANFMGPAIAASRSVGLPYGFAEFGLSTPVGRPGWLRDVGNYIMSSGALFATLFNGNQQYPTLRLTDSGSIAVWRSFISQDVGGPAPVPSASTGTPAPSQSVTPKPSQPPAPIPSASTSSAPAQAPGGPAITGLTLEPPAFTAIGSHHTLVTFTMSQKADVTVCVLTSSGTLVRQLTRPGHRDGLVKVPYYGYGGDKERLPAGSYTILVVASNSDGSASAETTLTINAP